MTLKTSVFDVADTWGERGTKCVCTNFVADPLSVCSPRMICDDSRCGISFCSADGIGWAEWVVCVVIDRDGKQPVVIADVLLALLAYKLYRSFLDH